MLIFFCPSPVAEYDTFWIKKNNNVFTVAQSADLSDVSGYLGDDVILPSGADKSWNLLKIEWSILSNNTKIATFRNKKPNTDRFYRYKGRLDLNTSSGKRRIYLCT